MEFELAIIRDGVRTVIAACEELQARSEGRAAVHRSYHVPAIRDLTLHEAEMGRMFLEATDARLSTAAPEVMRNDVGSVAKTSAGDTLHSSTPPSEVAGVVEEERQADA